MFFMFNKSIGCADMHSNNNNNNIYITHLSTKEYNEFVEIFTKGDLQKFIDKLVKEKISPNATIKTYHPPYEEGDVASGAMVDDEVDDEWEDTLLSIAVEYSSNRHMSEEFVKFLIIQGVEVNKHNYNLTTGTIDTALMRAVVNDVNLEIIELLINAGIDVNVKDFFDLRAIDYARENPKLKGTQVIKLLEKLSQ